MKRIKPSTFKWLDAIFWCIWLLAPFLIWQSFDVIWSHPYSYYLYGDMRLADVSTYSMQGKILVVLANGLDMLLGATILLLMHKLVRQFKRGDMLISATLRAMKHMACICIAMPIVGILVYNLNSYLLYRLGDLPAWQPLYTLDIMLVALGLFLYALQMLIQHAVALQKDVDLTV